MSANRTGAMTLEEIQSMIPHRPPMLLIDEVVEKTEASIICRKKFRPEEFFFQGHYPTRPLVPGVILCEVAMQSGAVLLAEFADQGIPVVTRMTDARFRHMVHPGDTVEVHVTLMERLATAFFLKAKMTRGDQQVMRFEFACTAAGTPS